MSSVSILGVLCLLVAGASAQVWWQCSVTHTSYLPPEMWTCTYSENCCLTGRSLSTTGCCKELKHESTFYPRSGYFQCSPVHGRAYYCPSNRDCCTVARSGNANETGCCVSQTAKDTPISSSDASKYKPGVEEAQSGSSQNVASDGRLHKHLSTGTILVIALIPIVFCVIVVVSVAYYCQMKKTRQLRRLRGERRAQLQAAALGLHPDDGGSIAYEASGIAPPSYWETVEEGSHVPTPAVQVVSPTSQSQHRAPPTGNIQYSRLDNEEDEEDK